MTSTAYDREFDFTSQQASTPSDPIIASHLDAEYNRIKASIDSLISNLDLIQRADGEIANASVGLDQLAPEVTVGFNTATMWATATAYTTSDFVFNGAKYYHCIVAHTSGTFATDLAAGKWTLLVDFSALSSATTSAAGVIEIATDAEAQAKSLTDRALVASNLAALDASDTFSGLIEIATDAEATGLAVTNRAVTPGNLAAVLAAHQATANTWSADQTISSADAGASAGPILVLDRNSASPANSDLLGNIPFKGRDNGAGTDTYADIVAKILDVTAASEDGALLLRTAVAGALTAIMTIGPGVQIGSPTGGDKGAGTLNAQNGLYDKGFRAGTVLLTSGSVSAAATLDLVLTSYTSYRGIIIELAGFIPATDGADLYMRFSTDGGSTYDAGAGNYSYATQELADTAGRSSVRSNSATQMIIVDQIGSGATEGANADIRIWKQTSTALWTKAFWFGSMVDNAGTPSLYTFQGAGTRRTAQDTDAVRFLFSAGNITSGDYAVYGLL